MNKKKKQHYVPKFYFRLFSPNNKSIGLYNLNNKNYIESASIKNQAYEKYFYGKTEDIEDSYGFIENKTSKILNEIIKEKKYFKFPSKEYTYLILFIGSLLIRTKEFTNELNESIDKLLKKIYSHSLSMRDIINKVEIKLNDPTGFAYESFYNNFKYLLDLDYKILINQTERTFVTSDNPVIKYSQFFEKKRELLPYGFASKGLELFLPISEYHCILFYDKWAYKVGGKKHYFINLENEKDIEELNKLQLINSENNIYYNPNNYNKKQCENLYRKSKKYLDKDKVEVKEFVKKGSTELKGESLIFYSKKPTYIGLNISKIWTTKKAKKYKINHKFAPHRNPELVKKLKNK